MVVIELQLRSCRMAMEIVDIPEISADGTKARNAGIECRITIAVRAIAVDAGR